MGFKVIVNGDIVWESAGAYQLVDRVSVSTSRGESASVAIDNSMDCILLDVNIRDDVESSFLDLKELQSQRAHEEAVLAKTPPAPEEAGEFDI